MGAREGEEREEEERASGSEEGRRRRSNRHAFFFLSLSFFASPALSLVFARFCTGAAAPSRSSLSLSLSLSFSVAGGELKGKRRAPLLRERLFFWRFCLLFFFPFEEMIEQSAQIGSGNSSRRQQREKDETEKAMPASLLRSASASAAVAAAPPACRGARLLRTAHAAPSRTPVGVVAAGGRLPRRRQWNDASSSTAATKAVPTANTFAAPATAEQRPIPGEDLFMVREGRHSISP